MTPQERCPTCGSSAEPGQLVCLECGSRIELDYRKPPNWRFPAAILAVVVLLAGAVFAVGLREVTNDAKSEVAAQAPGEAQPQRASRTEERAGRQDRAAGEREGREREGRDRKTGDAEDRADGDAPTKKRSADEQRAEKRRADERQAEKERSERSAEEPSPGRSRQIESWPKGKNAFTVVLLAAEDPVSARKFARDVLKTNTRVAVLDSDNFTTLGEGFWVVVSGVYPSRAKAQQAAARLDRRFQGAYPQFVDGASEQR